MDHHASTDGPRTRPVSEETFALLGAELWQAVPAPPDTSEGGLLLVYLVDGFAVRNYVDVGWIGGGHPLQDPFVPAGQIWIERNDKHPDDDDAILVHELKEYALMSRGIKYDAAHHAANEAEAQYRRERFSVPAPHNVD